MSFQQEPPLTVYSYVHLLPMQQKCEGGLGERERRIGIGTPVPSVQEKP